MLKENNMSNIIKKLLFTIFVSTPFIFVSGASASTSNSSPTNADLQAITASLAHSYTSKPTVSTLSASPTSLTSVGGFTTLSATVKYGSKCVFSVSPNVSGVSKTITCGTGKVSYKVKLPKNQTTTPKSYKFMLKVTNSKGYVNAKPVTVKVEGIVPTIKSFISTQNLLLNSGGSVTLSGTVTNESSCSISVTPAISGFGGSVTCASGSFSIPATLPANTTANTIDYTFTFKATNSNGSTTSLTLVGVKWKSQLSGINNFSNPGGPIPMVSTGNDIWVGDTDSSALTEINLANGQQVKFIDGASYHLSNPQSLAFDGTNIWVASQYNITEVNATTGALVKVISNSEYNLNDPSAMYFDGTNIWVANQGDNSITEIKASSGALVRLISGQSYELNEPDSIIANGADIWVANYGGNSLTEINASNGALVQVINNDSVAYDFNGPSQIIVANGNLLVVNLGVWNGTNYVGGNSLTEINASGTLNQVISGASYDFNGPISLLFDGTNIWVANYGGSSITEFTL
jgi:hypothetical protein